jgi:hypothetical protein
MDESTESLKLEGKIEELEETVHNLQEENYSLRQALEDIYQTAKNIL